MYNDVKEQVENDIVLDESSVWELVDKTRKFSYSEGLAAENYLKEVFLSVNDISSNSHEMEQWIKDWSSEYHLSRKRAQLLRGFNFKRSKKVLEVGCGCGAITRFLGETFDNVLAIEGSLARARLARLRTRDLQNVSIISAPFQEIKFKERFDIIFCIGVFEYANMYVDAQDPFNFILKYFHDILTPDGEIVIAIENQFGLKYFSSAREDHNNIMFDGLEGYPRYSKREKTFGYYELRELVKKYFENVNFYFPYPDYKTPSCILSEHLLRQVKAAQLVGNFKQNSYMGEQRPLFDERLTLLELDKNNMLPFFSNSFLVVAGKNDINPTKMKSLGIVYSNNRTKNFQTVTNFIKQDEGGILVEKKPANCEGDHKSNCLTLRGWQGEWIDGLSIHSQIMKRVKESDITMEELFAPAKIWFNHLKSLASCSNNNFLLEGKYLDCIWTNSFIVDGECRFIDLEFEWHEKININVLLIRSLYDFLNDISSMSDLSSHLKIRSMKVLIKNIAKNIGINLNNEDFKAFCKLESKLANAVFNNNIILCRLHIKLSLWNRSIAYFISSGTRMFRAVLTRVSNKIQNVFMNRMAVRSE